MSVAQHNSPQVTTPSSERLSRLTVAAAGYLGKEAGDTVPVEEVRLQAEANGYSDEEIDALLDHLSREVRVPKQGLLFGELWAHDSADTSSTGTPQAEFTDDSVLVQRFREALANKAQNRLKEYDDGTFQHTVEHAYSLHKDKTRDCRTRAVDRHFIKEYQRFTTVVVTYCAEQSADESVSDHAEKFYPASLSRTRWNIFNREIDTEAWAGCRLLAPKLATCDAPTPTPVFTHGHSVFWLEGWHSAEDFEPLRETFLSEVNGATEELNPLNEAIKIKRHTSAGVTGSSSVKRQGIDAERGPTTSASGEVASNLPMLRARNALRKRDAPSEEWARADARECPSYVERWAAHLTGLVDSESGKGGVSRWGTFGEYDSIADERKIKGWTPPRNFEKRGSGVQ